MLVNRVLRRVVQDGSRNHQNKAHMCLKSAIIVKKERAVPAEATKSPWVETKDPNGSHLTYYWNTKTNETTALGSARPEHWIEVKSDEGLYWWNPETQETTAIGALQPPSFTQISNSNSNYNHFNPPPQTLGSSMKTYFFLGIGMTVGITIVKLIIGI